MPVPWGPIIGAAGAIGGAYIGYRGQQQANAANAQQAKDAMAFEERMSNTAYQRGRADIEAAGYNPALAYSKGGADTPSGKQADIKNSLAAFGGSAQAAVDTFNSIRQTQAAVQKTAADTRLTDAQTTQLQLESAARAEQFRANAALAGTNARFAADSFDSRLGSLSTQYQRDVIDKNRARLEYDYHGDLYQRNKDVLWPIAVEQLRQNLTTSIAQSRNVQAQATLNELAIPTAENIAKMAKTAWGRNITPFLSDATTIARMLSIGAGTAGQLRPR